jgi:hypothetical protein
MPVPKVRPEGLTSPPEGQRMKGAWGPCKQARTRRRVGNPARVRNTAHGLSGRNPEGAGPWARPSLLLALRRHPVFAAASVAMDTPMGPLAHAAMA